MSAVLNHDLRSIAKDYRRVKAHNAKWSRGAMPANAARRCPHNEYSWSSACVECGKRPVPRNLGQNYAALRRAQNKKVMAQGFTSSKETFRSEAVEAVDDVHDHLSDSSGDLDIDEVSAAPELKDVMYSFDAKSGPSQGNEILSYAITQAVHRYENNETDKIVKKEYDLVLDGKEETELDVANIEDDFEIIDDVYWK